MVEYRNTRTGRTVRLAEALPSMDRSKRWERLDGEAPETGAGEASLAGGDSPAPSGPFDPDAHTVTQVNAYLAGADAGERERVLQAEAEGRGRRGILSGPNSDLSGS